MLTRKNEVNRSSTLAALFLTLLEGGYTPQTITKNRHCLSAPNKHKFDFDKVRGYTMNQKSDTVGVFYQNDRSSIYLKQVCPSRYWTPQKPAVPSFWGEVLNDIHLKPTNFTWLNVVEYCRITEKIQNSCCHTINILAETQLYDRKKKNLTTK